MKRGAEKQGGRDAHSDDDMDETETTGFVAADPVVLATRPMKAMPKRGFAMTTTPQKPSNGVADSEEQPKVEGFKFGGPPTSNAFSFTPPSLPTTSNTSQTQSSIFSSTSFSPAHLTSTTNSFGTAPPQPTVASKTTISQQASSFLSQPSSFTVDPENDERDQEMLKTLRSMRGLNMSFLTYISEQLKVDAFLDLSGLFKQYEDHKAIISNTKFNKYPSATKNQALNLSNPLNSTPALAKSSMTTPVSSMPTPPKSFAGFNFGSNTISSSSKNSGGDSSSKPNTGFSFTPVGSKPDDAPKASPFSFTAPPETKTDSLPSPPKSAFIFGTSPTKLSSDMSKPQSTFGSSIFSLSKDSQSNSFGSTTTTSSAFSVFANAASSSSNTDTTSSTSPMLTFGSSSSGSSFGAFRNKGSLGNPVGFSFGSPTPTPEPETPSTNNTVTSASPFFSAISTSSVPANKTVDSSTAESEISVSHTISPTSTDSRALTPATEAEVDEAPKVLGPNPHDEEGEGEEDEETTHSSRLKVYKLRQADGKAQWSDMGVGILRLKKHKTTGGRRMLLRNSATGKITINFKIFAALKPARDKNAISFVGHDEGKPATYRLRLKTVEQATELHHALDREIEFVKSKEDIP